MSAKPALRRGAGAPPSPPFAVDEAKIRLPEVEPGLVSRTALVNRLRANTATPVVALTAPLGYGKTTLLAQWARRESRPVAWITADARDRDPVFLLRHVAAALNEIEPLDADVFEALGDPAPSIWTAVLPRLGTALVSFPVPTVIVIDDAHLLRAPETVEAVQALSEHVSPGSMLVLAGRHEPKLAIASLRASGQLFELDADDLALTPRDAQAYARLRGADLTFSELTEIVRDCEGWPAAIHLRLTGEPGALAAYVRTEYLARLRPGALRFLWRTSILDELCGSLCDAVLDDHGSGIELEKVERSNLFLVPLEGRRVWYRYRRIFRDVLREELAAHEPRLLPALHHRAARWYEAHGNPEAAVEHAWAARDFDHAARLVATHMLPMYNRGRVDTVTRWLERFDDLLLLGRFPAVTLQGSWVFALGGRTNDAERWLAIGDAAIARRKVSRQATTLRAWSAVVHAALCSDGVYQMIADAESALAALPRDSPIRSHALVSLGAGYLMLGQTVRADAILAEAAHEAERLGQTGTQVLAIGERSIIATLRNDGPAAEKLADEAHAIVEQSGLAGYLPTAVALAASARAALRHGRWDEAREDIGKAEGLTAQGSERALPWFSLQTRIELARAHLALRDTVLVQSLLGEIRDLIEERPHVGTLVDEADALEQEIETMSDAGGARPALTPAELRLLPYLATQLSFREIGEQLFVSRNTIKTQAISVYRKLGVASRSGAIDCAARLGLVEMRPSGTPPFTPRG